MTWLHHVVASSSEVLIFLAVAIGTLLGRVRTKIHSIGPLAIDSNQTNADPNNVLFVGELSGFMLNALASTGSHHPKRRLCV